MLKEHGIETSQIQSTVADGAYHHESVWKHLERILEVAEGKIHHVWDPMHKSALPDKHVLEKCEEFAWVVDITDTVQRIVKLFKVGKKFFLLQRVCERLEERMAHLSLLSETRMANYKYVVFKNFLANYRSLLVALEELHREKESSGTTKERQEADYLASCKTEMFNQDFVLKLTGALLLIIQNINNAMFQQFLNNRFERLLCEVRIPL